MEDNNWLQSAVRENHAKEGRWCAVNARCEDDGTSLLHKLNCAIDAGRRSSKCLICADIG
jgi:hypothetical protein